MEVENLRIQQGMRSGDFELYKIPGERNPGNLFGNRGLSQERVKSFVQLLGYAFCGGRAGSARNLRLERGVKVFEVT